MTPRPPMRCFQLTGFGERLSSNSLPTPVPTGSEVLVKVRGAGVCHSDVHIYEGHYDLGGGRKLSFADRIKMPLTLGHETAGEAVECGPEARGIELGRNYLVCSWVGCGRCAACLESQEHLCAAPRFLGVNQNGGYADYVLVPHPRYLVDLGDLDPVAAAPLVCSGLTTFSALRKFGSLIQKSPLVIIGAGGLGLIALGILKILGGQGAIVVELDARKRAAALSAGAIAAIDPKAEDAVAQIRTAVGGSVHGVLDLVGSGETATLGVDCLDKGGRLVVVGLFGGSMNLPVPMIPMKSLTIQGSYIGSPAELRELVALVREHGMPATPLDRRPLSAAPDALDDLRSGQVVGRVVLTP
jgi:D-arabinose 1-dehydrogenase-like Zn-dependent alcohol dehydrogenase